MFELFFSKPNQRKNTSLYAEGSFSSASHTLSHTRNAHTHTHTHALQRNKSRALFFFFFLRGCANFFSRNFDAMLVSVAARVSTSEPRSLVFVIPNKTSFFTETCENKNKRTLIIKNRTLGENMECPVF